MRFNQPRLFLSYSRRDLAIARPVKKSLVDAGYYVYMDESAILPGDVFPNHIVEALKRTDGFVALISTNSASSEWCKLEAYYAHFYQKVIIPVCLGAEAATIESPLKSVQQHVQYFVLTDSTQVDSLPVAIGRKLQQVKRRTRFRLLREVSIFATIALVLGITIWTGINKINVIAHEREKDALLESIARSTRIFNRDEVNNMKKKFDNDWGLIAELHLREADEHQSATSRLNAKIIASALLQSFSLFQRTLLENIQWNKSDLHKASFNNTSIISPNLKDVDIAYTKFDDVYWGKGDAGPGDVYVTGSRFSVCRFNTVVFDSIPMMDVNFKACTFKGSTLNTTYFSLANFFSDTTGNPFLIDNTSLMSFINCTIENNNPPDPPNTIVLGKEEEMQFTGVLFDGCRFKGLVRPEWFNKCHFIDCVFPSESIINELSAAHTMRGNKVDQSIK